MHVTYLFSPTYPISTTDTVPYTTPLRHLTSPHLHHPVLSSASSRGEAEHSPCGRTIHMLEVDYHSCDKQDRDRPRFLFLFLLTEERPRVNSLSHLFLHQTECGASDMKDFRVSRFSTSEKPQPADSRRKRAYIIQAWITCTWCTPYQPSVIHYQLFSIVYLKNAHLSHTRSQASQTGPGALLPSP